MSVFSANGEGNEVYMPQVRLVDECDGLIPTQYVPFTFQNPLPVSFDFSCDQTPDERLSELMKVLWAVGLADGGQLQWFLDLVYVSFQPAANEMTLLVQREWTKTVNLQTGQLNNELKLFF